MNRNFITKNMFDGDTEKFNAEVDRVMGLYGRSEETKLASREEAVREIVADSTIKIINSDEFAQKLSNYDESLATKIKNVVKEYLEKLKTLISRMEQRLKKENIYKDIKDVETQITLFMEALEGAKNSSVVAIGSGSTYFQIVQDEKGKNYVLLKEHNIFDNKPKDVAPHKFIQDELKSHVGEMYPILSSGKSVYIGEDLPKEYTHSEYTKKLVRTKQYSKLNVKNQSVKNLGEIINIGTNEEWEKNKKDKHKNDAKHGWYRYDSRVGVLSKNKKNIRIYSLNLLCHHAEDGKVNLYDFIDIGYNKTIKNTVVAMLSSNNDISVDKTSKTSNTAQTTVLSDNNISDKNKEIKKNFSSVEDKGQKQINDSAEYEKLEKENKKLLERVSPLILTLPVFCKFNELFHLAVNLFLEKYTLLLTIFCLLSTYLLKDIF